MIGVLVSGEGSNLQALIDEGLPIAAVASNRRDARALERAQAAGIATAAFELDDFPDREARDLAMADWLQQHGVDLVVCAGYMHLLRREFLDPLSGPHRQHPRRAAAGLPRPAPDPRRARGRRARDRAPRCTTSTSGVDTGPVIAAERVPVLPTDDHDSLQARVQAVEHRLLPQVVRELIA